MDKQTILITGAASGIGRETGYPFKYDTRSAFTDFVRCVKNHNRLES